MGLILFLIGLTLLCLPLLHVINPAWREPLPTLKPGSAELAAGKRVRVGGVAAAHEPPVPSPLDTDEQVLWCHAVVNKYKGPNLGKGPPATKTLKAATRFRLVHAENPEQFVLIDGHRLSASMVTLDHDPNVDPDEARNAQPGAQTNPLMELFDLFVDMSRAMSSQSIKVIRPGDRLWVSGRLRQGEDGLTLGRWAMVDNVPPELRHRRDMGTARMVSLGGGTLLLVVGLWLMLT
ncbi:MAG: hypothetical protein EA418_09790 [Wenzhouxiangellaceae bacterium]|nr:MAG: hypothetical protein EA418_09790 [Wenzhouxiangellaceae bacterium]